MQINFCGRLEKLYIVNPSTSLKMGWRALSTFFDSETAQKIDILTKE